MKYFITAILFLLTFNTCISQWITQPIPDSINFIFSMDFTDSQNGAGAGNSFQNNFSGKAIYTTNAGTNWVSATVPDSSRTLITIQFVNSVTGYSSGAYNLFFKDRTIYSEKIYSNIFVSGYFETDYDMMRGIQTNAHGQYKGLFLKTTSGGSSWNTFGNLPDSVYYLIGLNFINENTGFATASYDHSGGIDDRIIKTTNGGNSWIQLSMPGLINNLRNIFFVDDNHGYAVGYKVMNDTPRAAILRTDNSGISWTLQIFPDIVEFNDINFSDTMTGFVTGRGELEIFPPRAVIYKTTDGGFAVNNTLIDQNNWYMSVSDNIFRNNLGATSSIMHSTNGGTSISPVNNTVPDNFQLYQNYPNPFNPSTKIKFQISEAASVNLIVYDILGKEIKTIVNDRFIPGTYEAEFDGSGLTSGIYFYHIKIHSDKIASGEFSEVRKMLLIK